MDYIPFFKGTDYKENFTDFAKDIVSVFLGMLVFGKWKLPFRHPIQKLCFYNPDQNIHTYSVFPLRVGISRSGGGAGLFIVVIVTRKTD